MADSKLQNADDSSDDELNCGICFAVIDKPKALPCLHTFCQKCLTSWYESTANKHPDKYTNVISCPSCREDFPLPEGGVQNLRSNFFVTKMKDRKSIQRKLQIKDAVIPCTSCSSDTTPGVAVQRCVECNDFLCNRCVEVHKSVRVLQKHQLVTLDELRSGKPTIHNLPEQETCSKHKGEVLRFYCETCDEPICRDCCVVDHPRPDHKQVDLESTAKERVEYLLKVAQECAPVAKEFDNAIATDEQIKADLDVAFENAMATIKQTTDTAVTSVTDTLKKIGKAKEKELQQLKARRDKDIEAHLDSVNLMRIRLTTALEMTQKVTENGSIHDVATMYSSLANNMKQSCDSLPPPIRKSFAKVKFVPNEDVVTNFADSDRLGILKRCEQWSVEKSVGHVLTPRSVVFNSNGDIAVTDNNRYKRIVKVYDQKSGQRRFSLNTNISRSRPWAVAIGVIEDDDQYFFTDQGPDVQVFDSKGNFKRRFGTPHLVDGQWVYNQGTQLYGLSICRNQQVYIGSSNRCISVHNQDGSHVSSFETAIFPYYIAVSSADQIFVSDHASHDLTVHVYDITGSHLHAFEKPEGEENWYPTGLCCASANEVLVACNNPAAVYRYSSGGHYLEVVTKELQQPWDIAINEDGDQLAVIDKQEVKLFQLN
ncbi:uncharacterized protein [Amphiura filiformis]|uniref:uncharacterized protein n=1 Tax=Amphiura filiformis TaxID=82378 RepID=UPI003B213C87